MWAGKRTEYTDGFEYLHSVMTTFNDIVVKKQLFANDAQGERPIITVKGGGFSTELAFENMPEAKKFKGKLHDAFKRFGKSGCPANKQTKTAPEMPLSYSATSPFPKKQT